MSNYNSEWRVWAKCVAVIDLIIVFIQLLASSLMTFFAGALTVEISESTKGEEVIQEAEIVAWALWLGVAIMILQTCVGLWAAIQLFKATELGREANDAYKRSHYWQIVSFVFIVFNVISGCIMGTYIGWVIVEVLLRIVFLMIVYHFMWDLQVAIITTPRRMTQKV